MKSWKMFEKEVAKYFGGIRRIRISYSEKIGDVIHPKYSIECKYGKCIPKYLRYTSPVCLVVGKKKYMVVSSRIKTFMFRLAPRVKKKRVVFLEKAVAQAKRYNPTLQPLVCVKHKNQRGFNICYEVKA